MRQSIVLVSLCVLAVLAACEPRPADEPIAPSTAAPSLPETPVVNPRSSATTPLSSPIAIQHWHTYMDDHLSVTFEYWCSIEEEDGYLEFSDMTSFSTEPANGLSLEQYVDGFMEQFAPENYPARDDARLDGDPRGIIVSTVEAHHPILRAFFQRGDTIYRFDSWMRILTSCDAVELGVRYPDVFYRTVESFRFTQ